MFLSRRSNGYFYIFYQQANRKFTSRSTGTKIKSEALKALVSFEKNYVPFSEILLKEFISIYLRHSEAVHKWKTTKDISITLIKFLKSIGNIALKEISTAQINQYLKPRLMVSSYTGGKDLRYLKAFFSYAVLNDYLSSNPASKIKRIRLPERQPLFFTTDEFERLTSSIEVPEFKDFVIFSVNTGLRLSEQINLHWSQINLENQFLILDNSTFLTKSGKVRTIPLNKKSIEVLKRRFSAEGIVFLYNGQKFKPDFVSKKFKKYVLKCGLNPRLHFHSLRHSFASWLIQKGAPLYFVSQLLGHADISTTQIYSHLNINNLSDSVRLLD